VQAVAEKDYQGLMPLTLLSHPKRVQTSMGYPLISLDDCHLA
jgi:hypothetical protein